MNKYILFPLIFVMSAVIGQPVSLHLLGGFTNYSGDIQQSRFTFNQAKSVVSAGATFNITDRFAIRSDYSFAHLGADDKLNKAYLKARNFNFKTIIQELDVMGEYTILNIDNHRLSPYIFAGIGVFTFSPYTTDSSGNKVFLAGLSTEGQGLPEYPNRKVYKKTQFNIPLGGGVKFALSEDLYVGFEIGFRKLFTDYLDDLSTTYIDRNILLNRKGQQAVNYAFRGDELKPPLSYPAAGALRGNSKRNDYYYYGQFRIGLRMPWFDHGGSNTVRSGRKGLGCPALRL